jgi:hypothetical protein
MSTNVIILSRIGLCRHQDDIDSDIRESRELENIKMSFLEQ